MVRTQTASRHFSFRQSAAVQAGSSQAGGVFSVSAPGCTITPCPTARYCASDATARVGEIRLARRDIRAARQALKLAMLRATHIVAIVVDPTFRAVYRKGACT